MMLGPGTAVLPTSQVNAVWLAVSLRAQVPLNEELKGKRKIFKGLFFFCIFVYNVQIGWILYRRHAAVVRLQSTSPTVLDT